LSPLVATFSCFRFTPGLAFGEKDIGHPAITEYLSLTGQGKLQFDKLWGRIHANEFLINVG
jgi:hypothetical protein